ncbi:hypothetical protein PR048_023218 [Dryococelus australis]|uniref:Uncharacterized protein n=1 Tax=Dryococelus australis TaxID=614101 RepID=A0ABQ9GTH0_9NEOP|nr:hypothetical protein PR048_023218 [Dryococelus australis]
MNRKVSALILLHITPERSKHPNLLAVIRINRNLHATLRINSKTIRATVTERLACSPPTKANRVQSPLGPLPDFRIWESCRTMPLVGGVSRGSPVSPTLSFRRSYILTLISLSALKPSLLRAVKISSLTPKQQNSDNRRNARLFSANDYKGNDINSNQELMTADNAQGNATYFQVRLVLEKRAADSLLYPYVFCTRKINRFLGLLLNQQCARLFKVPHEFRAGHNHHLENTQVSVTHIFNSQLTSAKSYEDGDYDFAMRKGDISRSRYFARRRENKLAGAGDDLRAIYYLTHSVNLAGAKLFKSDKTHCSKSRHPTSWCPWFELCGSSNFPQTDLRLHIEVFRGTEKGVLRRKTPYSRIKTHDSRLKTHPKAQDTRLKTQDPRPKTQDSRTQESRLLTQGPILFTQDPIPVTQDP